MYLTHTTTYIHIGTSYTDSLLRNKKLMFDEIVFKFFYIFGIRKPKSFLSWTHFLQVLTPKFSGVCSVHWLNNSVTSNFSNPLAKSKKKNSSISSNLWLLKVKAQNNVVFSSINHKGPKQKRRSWKNMPLRVEVGCSAQLLFVRKF